MKARNPNSLPSLIYMKECLRLDSVTGELWWICRPLEHFKSKRIQNLWNSKYVGKRAGYTYPKNKRTFFKLDGRNYYNSIVCWALYYNKWPTKQIDHIDRNPDNNKPQNLREADFSQQQGNINIRKSNKLGYRNIYKSRNGSYIVDVRKNRTRYVKTFQKLSDAASWASTKRLELYGEFASCPEEYQQALEELK